MNQGRLLGMKRDFPLWKTCISRSFCLGMKWRASPGMRKEMDSSAARSPAAEGCGSSAIHTTAFSDNSLTCLLLSWSHLTFCKYISIHFPVPRAITPHISRAGILQEIWTQYGTVRAVLHRPAKKSPAVPMTSPCWKHFLKPKCLSITPPSGGPQDGNCKPTVTPFSLCTAVKKIKSSKCCPRSSTAPKYLRGQECLPRCSTEHQDGAHFIPSHSVPP